MSNAITLSWPAANDYDATDVERVEWYRDLLTQARRNPSNVPMRVLLSIQHFETSYPELASEARRLGPR